MRLADQYLLAQIREKLLSHIPDDQWKLVEEEVDKAGGVREVGGYTGVLLTDAISKASFGGDRSAAGRYAAEQRWKGHEKGGAKSPQSQPRYGVKTPREGARLTESEKAELPSRDLAYLANTIISDLKTQGKSVPSAAEPYLRAMRTMGSINENYGMDTGASIVSYLLSNLASYKGETAKIIKAELRSRLKNQRLSDMEPLPSASTSATATDMYGRTQEIQSDKAGSSSSSPRITSLKRDIEYTRSNLNRLYQSQTNMGAGDEARMRQYQTSIDRQEKILSNLKAKLDELEDETSPGYFSS